MIVVFCFFPGDRTLAVKAADWMNELGPYPNHSMLIIRDSRCEPIAQLGSSFGEKHEVIAKAVIDGWPAGCNYFFRLATSWLEQRQQQYRFFFWIEPDAIPLKEGWLDALQTEFEAAAKAGKRFMGDRVQVEDVPLHLSGIAIYPNPLHAFAGEAYRAHEVAWDIAGKDQIVPKAHFTKLIEHSWKHASFTNLHELTTQIRPEAVIFHSSKDGSLIDLLRIQKNPNLSQVQSGNSHWKRFDYELRMEKLEWRDGCLTCRNKSQARKVAKESEIRTENLRESDAGKRSQERESKTTGQVPGMRSEESRGTSPGLQQSSGSNVAVPSMSSETSRGGDMTCDIFIRTYEGDYPWLQYCLKSIDKFCTGFRKVFITSPQNAPDLVLERCSLRSPKIETEWKTINEECDDHYLSQQITKLYADVFLDYQPDYILHVDSDNVFTKRCMPGDFFGYHRQGIPSKIVSTGKTIWYYTPYTNTETPWQPITEKFMQDRVEHEFMRRHPILVPRWLYSKFREFAYKKHGMIISQYIRNQPERAFSEFNALGAFAWKFHRDKFHWVNTIEVEMPEPFVRQFHSWSGVTPEIKIEIEGILNGNKNQEGSDEIQSKKETVVPRIESDTEVSNLRRESSSLLGISSSESERKGKHDREDGLRRVCDGPNRTGDQEVPDEVSYFPSASPPVSLSNFKTVIQELAMFAKASRGNSIRVGQQLSRAGLK